MLTSLAILGSLAFGLVIGLTWRGFVMLGDRRQLGIMIGQLTTEDRMNRATAEALYRMRRIAREAIERGPR